MRVEFICHFFSKVRIDFQTYATSTSRLLRSCHMQAYQLAATNRDEARLHAVGVETVEEYVTVQVHLSSKEETQSVALGCICWLQPMPQSDRERLPPLSRHEALQAAAFHAHEGRTRSWKEKGEQPLLPKGLGRGLMVSDFVEEYSGFFRVDRTRTQRGQVKV